MGVGDVWGRARDWAGLGARLSVHCVQRLGGGVCSIHQCAFGALLGLSGTATFQQHLWWGVARG